MAQRQVIICLLPLCSVVLGAPGAGLCPNPGFETAGSAGLPAQWEGPPKYTEWCADAPHSGERCAKVFSEGGPTVGWTSDLIPVRGGNWRVALNAWAKTERVTGRNGAFMVLYTIGPDKRRNGQTCMIPIGGAGEEIHTSGWTLYEAFSPELPASVKYVRVNLRLYHAAGTAWFDDVQVTEYECQPLDQARPIRRSVRVAVAGQPACAIAPSTDGRVQAEAIQAAIRDAAGVTVPIVDASTLDLEHETRDLILLGNLATSPAVEHLYLHYYTYEDRYFPGDGGYVLRPLYDPLGSGQNFMVVGASDPAGLGAGADALVAEIRAGAKPGELVLRTELAVKAGKGYRGIAAFPWRTSPPARELSLAAAYLKSGDKKYAQAYRERVLGKWLVPDDQLITSFTHLFWRSMSGSWDVMDSCGVFSDQERVTLTKQLLKIMRSSQGRDYSGNRKGLRSRGNHPIRAARGFYFGWRHFRKYYRPVLGPELGDWEQHMRGFWASPFASHRSFEDTLSQHAFAGSLSHTLHSALCEPDWAQAFLHGGFMHRMGERCIAVCNNLGTVVNMGDTSGGDYPAVVFAMLAYHYRDGRYLFVLNKRGAMGSSTDEPFQGYAVGVEPIEPVDHVGVHVAPADEYYCKYGLYYHRDTRPAIERGFDKLTFRAGWDAADDYLMLDGVAGGGHSYDDTNTIGQYSANGRIWLCQPDKFNGPTMNYHCGLTVARDGFGMAGVPPCAELMEAAQGSRFGYTATALRHYNGVDWTRHIFWLRNQCFFVVDEAKAIEPGDYSLALRWRGMGAPRLEPGCYRAAQDERPRATVDLSGAKLVAASARDSGKVLKHIPSYDCLFYRASQVGDFVEIAFRVRRPGTYDARMDVLDYTGRGMVQASLDGQPLGPVVDLLHEGAPRRRTVPLGQVKIPAAGKHLLRFEVVGKNARSSGYNFAVCSFSLQDPVRAAKLAAGSVNRFLLKFPAHVPATLEVDREVLGPFVTPSRHHGQSLNILEQSATRAMKPGDAVCFQNLFYATTGEQAKSFELRKLTDHAALVRTKSAVALVGVAGRVTLGGLAVAADCFWVEPTRAILVRPGMLDLAGRKLAALDGHVVEADITDPATRQRLAQLLEAEWQRLSSMRAGAAADSPWAKLPTMDKAWRVDAPGSPLDLAIRRVGQAGTILVSDRTGEVREIDAAGRPLATFATDGPVHSVAAADLDSDGRDEVLVGSDDEHIYALHRALKLRWKYRVPFMRKEQPWMWWTLGSSKVRRVLGADITGDGTPEVLAGAGNMRFHALDSKGKPLWHYRTDHGTPNTILAADLYHEGKLRPIVGMGLSASNGYCRVLDETGKLLATYYNDPWCSTLKAIAVCDLNRDGANTLLCGNNRGNLRGYAATGPAKAVVREPAWMHNLAGAVRSIALAPGKPEGIAVVGGDSGYLCAFRENGERVWGLALSSGIVRVAAVPSRGIIAACKDGHVFLLSEDGKLLRHFDCGEQIVDAAPLPQAAGAVVVLTNKAVWRLAP